MNTEKTYTTITSLTGGTIRLEHNYPQRPSWKCHGQGRAMVDMTVNPKWDCIDIKAAEVPDSPSNRGTKAVYVGVPVGAVIQLLVRLGYTVTPPPKAK